MLEMVQFLWRYGESHQSKRQYGRGWRCGEGDCGGPGVATLFTVIEVMQRRRRKLSRSWRVIVSRFYFFALRRIWYVFLRGPM